jgi:uncharacterized phage protein (TIGR01671 family)
MQRELKFRIWNGVRFVTQSDTYIKTCDGSLWDYYKDFGGTFTSNERLWSATGTIQQYTGLKDKNGVEIYEGDIVKILYDKAIGEVYFDLNLGAFRLKDNSGKSYPIKTYRFNETNKPIGLINVADEVIGNIFENSELLK